MTLTVIVGWQLSAIGYAWVDRVCAFGVTLLIIYLAFNLFKRSVPILLDQYAIEPEKNHQINKLIFAWKNRPLLIFSFISDSHIIVQSVLRTNKLFGNHIEHKYFIFVISDDHLFTNKFLKKNIFFSIKT